MIIRSIAFQSDWKLVSSAVGAYSAKTSTSLPVQSITSTRWLSTSIESQRQQKALKATRKSHRHLKPVDLSGRRIEGELKEGHLDQPSFHTPEKVNSPSTGPWPQTTSPNGKTFPWMSYNQTPLPSTNTPIPTSTSKSTSAIIDGKETKAVSAEKTSSVPANQTNEETSISPSINSIPVNVPFDVEGVLDNASGPWKDKVVKLFSTQAIVVVRQLEMMNILIGFEEANKYQLLSPEGTLLGYLMEEDLGFRGTMTRQLLKTHRAFKATVLDTEGNVILRIRRPFSWINSRIYVSTPSESGLEADEEVIGEAQQEWHVYRRKYNQFVKREGEMVQFGSTDSGLLAWDFYVQNEKGEVIGSVNRNFAGFGRELFTDTGQYVLRFEGVVDELSNPAIPAPNAPALPGVNNPNTDLITSSSDSSSEIKKDRAMVLNEAEEKEDQQSSSVPAVIPLPSITFDQRAVMLACAISIDFDYFTRSRGGIGSGMGLWMPMPMGGTGGTDAGAPGAGGEGGVGVGEGDTGRPADGTGVPSESSESDLPTYEDNGYGSGSGSSENEGQGTGASGEGDSGGWGGWGQSQPQDDVMQDPWAQQGGDTEGGTWSWGDLFPSDD